MSGKMSGEMPPSQQYDPHPPLNYNPHDPSHYYRAVDGKYYWTPDGSPQPGQPELAKTPGINETPVDKPDINDKWGHEASKGYHMTPEGLRNLAKALEGDMNDLQSVIDSNQTKLAAIGAMGMSDWQSAQNFDQLASKAQTDFSETFSDIIASYRDVVDRLRATANHGEQAENDTRDAVRKQQSGSSGDAGGPTKKL